MARLLLGPILRHVGTDDATVWVETDRACTVEVLGHRVPTFCVAGHHYALVVVEGLEPGVATPYEVHLDGEAAWPPRDLGLPPSVIRPAGPGEELQLAFGSCRVSLPHEPPWLQGDEGPEQAHGIDALRALAHRMAAEPPERRPDHLLMLGDQIYADQLSPALRAVTERRPADDGARRDQLFDFGEYALAYREAWGEPLVRWLLSVLPSSMIFDDHEIHAEWKISRSWLEEKRAEGWYDRRIAAGLASYWVYQHLGNLSPAEVAANPVHRRLREAEDGIEILRELALGTDRSAGHSRWSFCRDLGRSRLIVVDSRAGRELEPGGRRMIDAREWAWIRERADGDHDHLLLASSVPFFLVPGLHHLEAWNEVVCDGRWGGRAARAGERIRRAAVLDHWAAFGRSFDELLELLAEVAAGGASGRPPRTIVLLSGDVHHSYLAGIELDAAGPQAPPVWQAVCSPYRKRLSRTDRAAMRFGASRAGGLVGRALARAAGVGPRPVRWRLHVSPSYDNQVGTLSLSEREARVRVETTVGSSWRAPGLRTRFERRLS
jgi:hypothetical protein